jgi:hypothetical protein
LENRAKLLVTKSLENLSWYTKPFTYNGLIVNIFTEDYIAFCYQPTKHIGYIKLVVLLEHIETSSQTSFGTSGGIAELACASVIHPRNLGSKPGIDRKYFLILFVLHSNLYL